jgi:uncharacterized membrane protein
MMGGWGTHWGMRGPGMLLGGLGMLLFWLVIIGIIGLVVWLVVRLIRSTSSKPAQSTQAPLAPQAPQAPQPDPVLEILRRRLAAGEITSQDYDELRQKLGV